jgi:hypothetical protein
VTWSHSVDPKARPGTTFTASVQAGSTKYNQYVATNPYTPFQNNLGSSIAYSKTWTGSNLTVSANENQNSYNHLINLLLPDVGYTVTTVYPFQPKEMIGTPKWYEKLGVGYNGSARSLISFYDTLHQSFSRLFDTLQWGAQHRFPISLSLPPVGSFMIAPFITYEETWLSNRYKRQWNDTAKRIDTVQSQKGFFQDRHLSFGVGLNTAIYGTYQFKHSRLIALRHVIRPTFNFSYQPNLSGKYYDVIQVDPSGRKIPYSQLQGSNIFQGYAYGQFGGINFGLDNNVEIKWRSKKDTGINAIKKIRIIDGLGFTSGYNFLQDTMKLQPFNIYLRSTLLEKINITATALVDPYQYNKYGGRVNRFVFEDNHFTLGRITSGSVAVSTSFQSKPRDPSKSAAKTPTHQITDPALLGDQQRLQDYIRRNPQEFVDFNLPWSVSLSYSLYFNKVFQDTVKGFKTNVSSNISFNNSFSLTPKWNFSTTGYFDFNTMQLTMFTMSISRDMHCWQMSINITPIGQFRNFSFTISPKSAILQNLRVNRSRYYYNY